MGVCLCVLGALPGAPCALEILGEEGGDRVSNVDQYSAVQGVCVGLAGLESTESTDPYTRDRVSNVDQHFAVQSVRGCALITIQIIQKMLVWERLFE